ncbi:hypothetical protein Pmar_PMAR006913, partial [Perkinsus marinus ATCC 50983]
FDRAYQQGTQMGTLTSYDAKRGAKLGLSVTAITDPVRASDSEPAAGYRTTACVRVTYP